MINIFYNFCEGFFIKVSSTFWVIFLNQQGMSLILIFCCPVKINRFLTAFEMTMLLGFFG
jgi:hypothetical protein